MNFKRTIPTPHSDVHYSLLDKKAVLLNLNDGVYHSLNPLGTLIWTLCDGKRSLQDILASVCSQYDVPEETAKQDLLQLMTRLNQAGLVELRSELQATN